MFLIEATKEHEWLQGAEGSSSEPQREAKSTTGCGNRGGVLCGEVLAPSSWGCHSQGVVPSPSGSSPARSMVNDGLPWVSKVVWWLESPRRWSSDAYGRVSSLTPLMWEDRLKWGEQLSTTKQASLFVHGYGSHKTKPLNAGLYQKLHGK